MASISTPVRSSARASAPDPDARQRPVHLDVHVAADQAHGVAKRDEVGRPLGRQQTRQAGGGDHVALASGADGALDQPERLAPHLHRRRGDGGAGGLRLGGDVHHPGRAPGIQVRQASQLHSTVTLLARLRG